MEMHGYLPTEIGLSFIPANHHVYCRGGYASY